MSHIYRSSFQAIMEPRISGERVDNVVNRSGFDGSTKVELLVFLVEYSACRTLTI